MKYEKQRWRLIETPDVNLLSATCTGATACTYAHTHMKIYMHAHARARAHTLFHEKTCKGKYNSQGKLSKTSTKETKQNEQLIICTCTSTHAILQGCKWLCNLTWNPRTGVSGYTSSHHHLTSNRCHLRTRLGFPC